MSLHVMPGETKDIFFSLPDEVDDITALNIRFFDEDEEQLIEYDEDSEEVYSVAGKPNVIGLTMPPEDTILYENRERGVVQLEWNLGEVKRIAKAIRITCGTYYYHDGGE